MSHAAPGRQTQREYDLPNVPHDTPLPYEPPASSSAFHDDRAGRGSAWGDNAVEGDSRGGAAGGVHHHASTSPIAPNWGWGARHSGSPDYSCAHEDAGPSGRQWADHRRESYRMPADLFGDERNGNRNVGAETPQEAFEGGGHPDVPPRKKGKRGKREKIKNKHAPPEKRPFREDRPAFTSSSVGKARAPLVPLDAEGQRESLPILLFDLNGTLTSHTFQRRSAGQNNMRPGTPHLRRLKERFRLGIYTSSSYHTVREVIPLLERAAGDGDPLFDDPSIVLHRGHTQDAPPEHKEASGKAWDTVKPLARYFSKLHRVLLVDDDAFKAIPGEESNMILVPRWNEEPADACIQRFVDTLMLATDGLERHTDLRPFSQIVAGALVPAEPPVDLNEIVIDLEAGGGSDGDDAAAEGGDGAVEGLEKQEVCAGSTG